MHGLGNDFIVVNNLEERLPQGRFAEIARKWCDRRFGIGGDGIVLVDPSKVANLRMRIFNADGSEAEMCGNGIRCLAKYVYDRRIHTDTTLTVETLAGVKTLFLTVRGKEVELVRVDMGEPILQREQIPMLGEGTPVKGEKLPVGEHELLVTCVSMGNPHCVTLVSDVDNYPVATVGPLVETHPAFPRKTNVEFIQPLSSAEVKMRVWERGCGETMACGSGACAAAVACHMNGVTDRKVTVHLLGGDLLIEWGEDNHVYMTGPAVEVFQGEVAL